MPTPTIHSGTARASSDNLMSALHEITVPSLTNGAMFVCLHLLDTQTSETFIGDNTVKWGGSTGDALTLVSGSEVAQQSSSRTVYTAWFYILSPTAGTDDLYWATTAQNVTAHGMSVLFLQGVDGTTPVRTAETNTGNGDYAESATMSTAGSGVGDLALYGLSVRDGVHYDLNKPTFTGASRYTLFRTGTDSTLDMTFTTAYETTAGGAGARADWSSGGGGPPI